MASESVFGPQLRERRARLERAGQGGARPPEVTRLLAEVDAALDRLEHGSFGLCETCYDVIEPERLAADPLLRFCLDHLSPAQQADLQRDLELAGRIQTALLPQRETVLPGWDVHYLYRPAGVVSGDTCDVWPEANSACLQPGVGGGHAAAAGRSGAAASSNMPKLRLWKPGQGDELELVAHGPELPLELRDGRVVQVLLPVEGGRAVVGQQLAGELRVQRLGEARAPPPGRASEVSHQTRSA